jgi:hypothetical protein
MFDDAQEETPETGWGHLTTHDDAPAVIDTLLRLDPAETYTKTELSELADVALKSLYLDGTLDHLVEMGFLEKHGQDGDEALFSVDTGSDVYEAAVAFDQAVAERFD